MRIGGLDVATTTGWSVINGDIIVAGQWKLAAATSGLRLRQLQKKVFEWVKFYGLDFVAIEAPLVLVERRKKVQDPLGFASYTEAAPNNPHTSMLLYSYNVAAQSAIEAAGCRWEHVSVQTHRKSFLGAGKIPAGEGKKLTLEQCRRLGLDIKSLDEADAVSVAWWGAGRCRVELAQPGGLFGAKK